MERFVEMMEALSRASAHGTASTQENELHSLLSIPIREYDDRAVPLEAGDPIRILHFLTEQRGLRPIDLTPVFGARSLVSLALGGKRELSKTHIRKLAEFFHVSPTLFLKA